MIEVLYPLYRITEWKDGAVFKTEPAGERWLPLGKTLTGQELEDGLRVGTPTEFKTRRV